MTIIKPLVILREELDSTPIVHGNLIYCKDTKEVFYDYEDKIRGTLSCVVCANESVRVSIPESKRRYDTLYYVLLTSKLYIMDIDSEEYKEVHYVEEIKHITAEVIDLRPGFIHNDIKYFSPYSTASTVIMEESLELPDGPFTLQDYIDNGKLGKDGFGTAIKSSIKTYIVEEDNTSTVYIDYPVGNFRSSGFNFILFKNSMFVQPSDYVINEDVLTVLDEDNYFDTGDELTFVFFYSVITNPNNAIFEIDGKCLIDGTVTSNKIAETYVVTGLEDNCYSGTCEKINSYYNGLKVNANITSKNTTGTPTININNLGEVPIVMEGQSEIPENVLHGVVPLLYEDGEFKVDSLVEGAIYNMVQLPQEEISSNYGAVYTFTKNGEVVGDPINIPKMISNGSLKFCEEKDIPLIGLNPGDPYIDLEIDQNNHIYIAAKDLVDQISSRVDPAYDKGNAITDITVSDNTIIYKKESTFLLAEDAESDLVSKDTTIAGIDLNDNISAEDLANALASNIQTDWNEEDNSKASYLKNRPESLKNPNPLKIGDSFVYDGSEEKILEASDIAKIITHPDIPTESETVESEATMLEWGEEFSMINSVERDENGHIIKYNIDKLKLPTPEKLEITPPSSQNTEQKIYLIGATTQTKVPDATYSHDTVYVGTDGCLYSGGNKTLIENSVQDKDGTFYRGTTSPTGTSRLNYSGYLYATRTYNAVYNDYAELFLKDDPEEVFEAGDVVVKVPGKNTYIKSYKSSDKLVVGVVSSQYGHLLGGSGDPEYDEKHYVAVGLAGRVNVKVKGKTSEGDLLISSFDGLAKPTTFSTISYQGSIIGKVLNILEYNETTDISLVEMLIMNS